YGTIGNGSLGHLAMTLLAKRAGIRLNHIPYRGGGPLVNDALGGHVPLAIASSAVLAAHLAAGTLRPIVQTGTARAQTLAAVPVCT
ncbi:tripartite tricarboxylate transporter substrate-binding protein, partial [Enterobacter cloacae]|uniref:tripartite tricarboxylate transporter substrate-binding protein n=1 Tax=Enterobacter cloacae TaxID=550 RepID=UPI0023B803DE